MVSSGILLSLTVLSLLEIGSFEASTLNPFIRHYEMINYDLNAVHQQHSRAVRSLGRPVVEIKFSSHKRDFHLRLKRDTSVFLPNVKLVTSDGEESPDVNYFYSGDIAGEPGSYCHGSITDGLFQGKIHVGDDVYSVEPATHYQEEADAHSVIYRAKDLDYSSLGSGGCGFISQVQKRMEVKLKEAEREEPKQETGEGSSYFARHKRQAPTRQTCSLFIQTDIEFYKRFGSRSAVIRQIGEHVQAASNIYSRTDFGAYQDIQFAVAHMRIFTEGDENAADYPFKDQYLGVEKYLDYASSGDHGEYCLAYTFTNRDFANGVLGLAWIATTTASSSGGICAKKLSSGSERTLNTGIVTVNNYGSFVPSLMSHNTFAHEIGHSFGSDHDSMSNQVCSPGGARGNYLMFAHATSGDLPNNDVFSSCSISMITSVLQTVFSGVSKENCFEEEGSVSVCGNEVVEEGEECDCGYDSTCTDSCCEAQTADNSNPVGCQLKASVTCSPQQGDCCDPATCNFRPASFVCRVEDECSLNATCTGNSVTCDGQNFKPDATICDNGRKICKDGVCKSSICEKHSLAECQCLSAIERCEVCCQNTGQPQSCVASSRINILSPDNAVLIKPPGSPCNNFMGYCDVFDTCRLADEDGPLAGIIRKIFYSDESQLTDAIWTWIKLNWWVVVIVGIILIIVMFLVVFVCNLIVPTTNPWRKAEKPERRASTNVQLQKKRNRGSRYFGQPVPPTSYDQHPDNAESRATRF